MIKQQKDNKPITNDTCNLLGTTKRKNRTITTFNEGCLYRVVII